MTQGGVPVPRSLDERLRRIEEAGSHTATAIGQFAREVAGLQSAVKQGLANVHARIDDTLSRVEALERRDHRPELASSHEWDALFAQAGQELSKRVKDPNDRLDSMRARAIAQEVVQAASTAEDAKAFRVWRGRGAAIAFEVVKVLVIATVSFLLGHGVLR